MDHHPVVMGIQSPPGAGVPPEDVSWAHQSPTTATTGANFSHLAIYCGTNPIMKGSFKRETQEHQLEMCVCFRTPPYAT